MTATPVAAVAMGFVSEAVPASAALLHRQPFDEFLPMIPLPCGSISSTQTSEGGVQGGFSPTATPCLRRAACLTRGYVPVVERTRFNKL